MDARPGHNLTHVSRILIDGVTGSGKSVLARRLAELTALPYHSVDDLAWQPHWVVTPVEKQRRLISGICAGDRWILDSAYGSWWEIPLARAQLVIGLDYPRWLSLARLVRRTARRIVIGAPICNGNRESLRMALSRESIILWHFRSFASKQRRMRAWRDDPDAPTTRLFRSPRALETWLRQFDVE